MPNGKSPFHRGEQKIQTRLGVRDKMEALGRRVIRDFMPEQHQEFFAQLPLLMVGTVDACGRAVNRGHALTRDEAALIGRSDTLLNNNGILKSFGSG